MCTPAACAQRKLELKLLASPQNGAEIAQLLGEIADVPPAPSKVDGLEYMDAAEMIPNARGVAAVLDILEGRYGETDEAEYWPLLTAPDESPNTPNETYEEFRFLPQLCVGRLEALHMATIPQMVFKKGPQAPPSP